MGCSIWRKTGAGVAVKYAEVLLGSIQQIEFAVIVVVCPCLGTISGTSLLGVESIAAVDFESGWLLNSAISYCL
ncbi:hypothetical protein [Microcoleus anatoxicus]|uniref:hypothetical protein n=1 Tax=Microcoleus anatoxicus TaxID=2705319 RepID=UPI0029707556|nr:MAG: hypothetical protein EA000_23195 [Oscillatoriales cyanobacterium]TAF68472.1 MAG: hypothetical protein EAZ59_11005 [Oscillatoriales cyanobacterium]